MNKGAYSQICERVQKALKRSGRSQDSVRILPVTKTISPQIIQEAYQAGERAFGESRVQELLEKKPQLPLDIQWHFIGNLQTNKAKFIVGEVDLIHSLGSIRLGEALQQEAEKRGERVSCLVQVNVSQDPAKRGFQPDEVEASLDGLQQFRQLDLKGLMTIGPLTEDVTAVRDSFRGLRELREKVKNRFPAGSFRELSMGMSGDFEIAIEEGATIIRIGTLLFGKRSI